METIYDSEAFFQDYAQMARSRQGLAGAGEWSQLEPLFPDLRGAAVLDLGCGYGWHCRYAAEHGAAEVLGIDASARMIAEARRRCPHPRVRYEVRGLEDYDYPPCRYDLVLSNLALHYVADLDRVYGQVRRTLKPGGVFLFNIEHPVFTAGVHQSWAVDGEGNILCWPVDRYFYPGERTTNFLGHRVRKQHHTLTQILMGLIRAGFVLEAVEEARPPARLLEEQPEMADELRRPMMLLVRGRLSSPAEAEIPCNEGAGVIG